MTYSPNVPQPTDVPGEQFEQYLYNFFLANEFFNNDHVPFAGVIDDIAQSNPCLVTSTLHKLSTGNTVTFQGLRDTDDLGVITGMGALNGVTATITVVDDNNFTLNGIDSTGYVAYIPADSFASYTSGNLLNGYHKKITYPNQSADPDLLANYSSVYTKFVEVNEKQIADLYYQNNNKSTNVVRLTGATYTQSTDAGRGVRTPWGIIINFGLLTIPANATKSFNFPIPYTTSSTNVFSIQFSPFRSGTSGAGLSPFINATSATAFQAGFGFNIAGAIGYYMAIGI